MCFKKRFYTQFMFLICWTKSFLHFISLTAPIVSWWMHANDKKAYTVSKKKLTEGHKQGHDIASHFQVIRTQIYMDGTNIARNSIKM